MKTPRLILICASALTPAGAGRAWRLWTTLGAGSLAAAAFVALGPGRMQDFHEVREWFAAWEFGAANPYLRPDLDLDYPPHAFLLLFPLGLLPGGIEGRLGYLIANVAVTVVAAHLLVRWTARLAAVDLSREQRWALAGMVLALAATRSSIWLGQTIGLALALAVSAMLAAERRPAWAGLALALGSFKPHVAVGFALALVLAGRIRVLLYAAPIGAGLFVLFGLTVGSGPMEMAAIYLANLDRLYAGRGHVMSVTSVRELLDALAGPTLGFRLHLVAAAAALAWVVLAARRSAPAPERGLLLAASCLAWCLMALPHQRHSLILLTPALWAILWVHDTAAARWLGVAAMAFMVLDVPLALRLAGVALAPEHGGLAQTMRETSYVLSRSLVAVVFVMVTGQLARAGRAAPGDAAAESRPRRARVG